MIHKKTKHLVVCTVLLSSLTLYSLPVYAADSTGTTPVSLTYTENDLFKLEVHVSEGGRVVKGSGVIEKGVVTYQLSLDDDPTFKLVPNKGYKVKDIIFERSEFNDSKSILNQMVDSEILIDIESTEMKLYIEFEKMNEAVEEPEGEVPNDEIKSPDKAISTGDLTQTGQYVTLLIVASFILVLVMKRKEEEEQKR